MRGAIYSSSYKIKGITLLEAMLVIAIATSIILLGFQVYQTNATENNYRILKANVDILFQAMKGYYQTECDLYFNTDGTVRKRGVLTFDPSTAGFSSQVFPVEELNRYIQIVWPKYTPVVDSSAGRYAYIAQYNPSLGSARMAYMCSPYNTGSPQCSSPIVVPSSKIVLWRSQIAVKMKDPSKTIYYVAMAGADCATNADFSATPGPPINCKTDAVTKGNASYMVWQRMPSFSSPNIRSSHWISNPVIKEFKLQYTHDPMYELSNPSATPSEVYKYYYCGG